MSAYGGISIRIFRDRNGSLPRPTPRMNIIRTPTIGGGENIQTMGSLRAEWLMDVETDSTSYSLLAFSMLGNSNELWVNDDYMGFWFLEEIRSVRTDVPGTVRCTILLLDDN